MIKIGLCLSLLLLGVKCDIFDQLPEPGELGSDGYFVIRMNSWRNEKCCSECHTLFNRIKEGYRDNPKVHFTRDLEKYDQDYQDSEALGLSMSDLSAVRVLHEDKIYSIIDPNLPDSSRLLDQSNLKYEISYFKPQTQLQKAIIRMQQSRYVELVKYLSGARAGYNAPLVLGTILLFTPLFAIYVIHVLQYFKKFGEEKLTHKHILYCLGLWILAKILLIPSKSVDIVFHQVWKTIGVFHPLSQFYETKCFALDYPPFAAYFETIWGYVVYLIAPTELALQRAFNISLEFYVLLRCTVIVTDFFYFFTLLALFRFVQSQSKSDRDQYNVKMFGLVLFDGSLLAIDNQSFQYNSFIFALIIWSIVFILQKRELLGAFLYSITVLIKQLSIYPSAAYVGYLLIHFIGVGKAKQVNWLHFIKLALIVIGLIIFAFIPVVGHFQKVKKQISGGQNNEVVDSAVATIQVIYAAIYYRLDFWSFRAMPPIITVPLILLGAILVITLIYRERFSSSVRLPLYMSLSGVVFFILLPIVHEKHLLFLSIPLMQKSSLMVRVQSLFEPKQWLTFSVEFKIYSFYMCINFLKYVELFIVKWPLMVGYLIILHHYVPQRLWKYIIFTIVYLVHDLCLAYYVEENQCINYQWWFFFGIGYQLLIQFVVLAVRSHKKTQVMIKKLP